MWFNKTQKKEELNKNFASDEKIVDIIMPFIVKHNPKIAPRMGDLFDGIVSRIFNEYDLSYPKSWEDVSFLINKIEQK